MQSNLIVKTELWRSVFETATPLELVSLNSTSVRVKFFTIW
jgi:hypothetical protein